MLGTFEFFMFMYFDFDITLIVLLGHAVFVADLWLEVQQGAIQSRSAIVTRVSSGWVQPE